jgi:hypothetical protein
MSYCNRCLQLFSPEGITEACSERGFVHSRVSGYFVLKYREECSLCWFINEDVYRKLRPMALSGFLSPSEDEHLRVWAYPADPSVREKAVASNRAYKLEFRMTTYQKRHATCGTGVLIPQAHEECKNVYTYVTQQESGGGGHLAPAVMLPWAVSGLHTRAACASLQVVVSVPGWRITAQSSTSYRRAAYVRVQVRCGGEE